MKISTTNALMVILLTSLTMTSSAYAQSATGSSKLRKGRAQTPTLMSGSAASTETMKQRLALFEISTKPFDWTLTHVRTNKTYIKWKLTFRSAIKSDFEVNNTVHATYYQPRRTRKPGPGALVLHHLGGGNQAEEVMAAHLAGQGVAAISMLFPYYGPRKPRGFKRRMETASPKDLMTFIKQAVADVRRCSDVLRSFPEVDNKRIGLMGISLGAIIGSSSAGIDGRFNRVVLALGGGKLQDVLFYGSPEVSGLRRHLDRNGITREQLGQTVKLFDPLTYASRIEGKSVLMLNASNDEIIPRSSTDALHKALGKPEIHWYNCGHYGAALHVFNIMRRALHHLRS